LAARYPDGIGRKGDRKEVIQVRVSRVEVAMLKAIAERERLTVSDVLRGCIQREYDERFGLRHRRALEAKP